MMKFLLIVIAFFFSITVNAQENPSPEINKIDSLIALSKQKTFELDIEHSLEYAVMAFNECEKVDYSKGKSMASFYIGNALHTIGNYQKALEYLTICENEKYTAESPGICAEIYRVRGRIYSSMGLNDNAIKEFNNGFKYIDKIENKVKRDYAKSMAYENLSDVYNTLNLPDSEYYYIQKNRELLQTLDETVFFRNWINLYNLLGDYYLKQTNFDSAAFFLNQSLGLSKKYDFPYVSTAYLSLGNLQVKQNQLDSALKCYFNAVENLEKTDLESEYPAVYKGIAAVYEQMGMPDKAKEYKEKGLLIDNELANEKLNATGNALDIILKAEEEKTSHKNRLKIYFLTGGFLGLLIVAFVIYMRYRKKSSKVIKDKEQETLELKHKVNESFVEVLAMAKRNDPAFLVRFKEVYPEFSRRLLQKHPDLINSEFSFCALIFLNFTSKEIAQITYVEHRSIQTRKSRLRKKLDIPSTIDMHDYLRSFSEDPQS